MKVKFNKIASDNKALSDNLSDNTIACNNGNDNFSKNSLINFNNCFNNLDKTIAIFFPSMRNAIVERYRAETFYKIGLKASEILKILNLQIKPIPPKGAIPLFDRLSLEHEEAMYDSWAKLLVEAATDYNPILLQYAEILSKISKNEALLLKDIYYKQKDNGGKLLEIEYERNLEEKYISHSCEEIEKSMQKQQNIVAWAAQGFLTRYRTIHYDLPKYKEFICPYYIETEQQKEALYNQQYSDIIKSFDEEILDSVNLLVQLNLIYKQYSIRHIKNAKDFCAVPSIGLFLTEFGYSMLDCLENKYKD